MLAWLDEAAATWACSVCKNPNMVTVKIDEMVFERPVKNGHQVNIYGEVTRIGSSSITIYIEARNVNFYTGEEKQFVQQSSLLCALMMAVAQSRLMTL